jgi:hypothetical protein
MQPSRPSTWSLPGAASDTLAWGLEEVLPVAIAELEKNDWQIQRTDSSAGAHRIVTRWKPLKHALAGSCSKASWPAV